MKRVEAGRRESNRLSVVLLDVALHRSEEVGVEDAHALSEAVKSRERHRDARFGRGQIRQDRHQQGQERFLDRIGRVKDGENGLL